MPTPLSAATIAIIKATVPPLKAHGPAIATTMYRHLLKDESIAALFNHANQTTGAQPLALSQAVIAYAENIDNPGALGPVIERISQKHIGYVILPAHYPYVADALLTAIKEVLGDAASPEVLAAWGEAYWFLANVMIDRETEIRAEILAQPGGWTDWRRFVISDRHAEADEIVSFTLRPEDGGPVVPHQPGQYLTLRLDIAGLAGVKRNYSVSGAPDTSEYRITVKRDHHGQASAFLHDKGTVGTVLEIAPPAGDFQLPKDQKRPLILLSGGVGLTPFVSMMEVISTRHRDVQVYYVHGETDRAHHALDREVLDAATRHGNAVVTTFYETGSEGSSGHGRITMEWLLANTPVAEADIYLCGPRPFLRHFVSGLVEAGVSAARIHYEFFGPADEQLAA
ncbi:MAG: NO-inducible flavohemoprotein [Paracoccus sp. (in: a-proteobacteria)]|uniref:NO-inducible flavohemoprotein n=1 Tax=Paracoccus sp. TaxID=267 RepID=UPI00391DE5EA